MECKRPIVRYHGGKWKLAPWIISHFDFHRVYCEPFGGGASVLLRKPRSYAEVYNDLDSELVNLFTVVRDQGEELIEKLRFTPFSRSEFLSSYQETENELEQARRTVVRSFMGFGSNSHNRKTGFRSDSNRSGTTPAHDWKNYPLCLHSIIDRLQGVVIENKCALQLMESKDTQETLHYVDPPYVQDTRDKGSDYRYEMNDADHDDLSKLLHRLKGQVVLSGYRCDMYDELYSDWFRIDRNAYADGASKRVESIWISREPRQMQIFPSAS